MFIFLEIPFCTSKQMLSFAQGMLLQIELLETLKLKTKLIKLLFLSPINTNVRKLLNVLKKCRWVTFIFYFSIKYVFTNHVLGNHICNLNFRYLNRQILEDVSRILYRDLLWFNELI